MHLHSSWKRAYCRLMTADDQKAASVEDDDIARKRSSKRSSQMCESFYVCV